MNVVVQKYGGSSLADIGKIRAVAEEIVERHRAGVRVVVVVSAMGKTTDQLLAQAATVSEKPNRRELDMLVTAGERISMALMSMAIHELGEDAVSFTGSQSGIVTESAHQGARILEVRAQRIEESLARGRIVIVAGYQGVSLDREVTTLGRGGSDTSAVALAAALGASVCEIYSDVDGVYSADPRVCPQAKLLSEIPYEVMQTMAGSGAKVLNAHAVEFARRAEIEIVARKTGDRSGRQTRISRSACQPPSTVHAVIGAPYISRIRADAAHWQQIEPALLDLGARVMRLVVLEDAVEAWVDRTGVVSRDCAAVDRVAAGARITHGAAVTVVGADAGQWRMRALETLSAHAIASLVLGPSDLAVLVDEAQCDDAVRALHRALVD